MRRIIAIVALLGLAACGSAEQADTSPAGKKQPAAKATTSADKDQPAKSVQRIVPLNGDIAEVVWALGLGDQVVGVDVSATYPKEAAAHPKKIGYQRQLSAEGILSLKPTIAIGTDDAGPPEVLDQLRNAGVKVSIIKVTRSPDGVAAKIREVGAALGVSDEAGKLAASASASIDAATKKVGTASTKPKVAFVYARGKDTLMLGGRGTRADGVIDAAGGIDAGTLAGVNGYAALTPEALVKAAPDVFLLLDGGLDSLGGVEGFLKIPGVAQTPAGKNRNILHYNDQLLLGLGPRTGSVLRQLIGDLHPELGK